MKNFFHCVFGLLVLCAHRILVYFVSSRTGKKKRENLIRCLITRGALITDISSALHTTVVSRKIGYTFEVASFERKSKLGQNGYTWGSNNLTQTWKVRFKSCMRSVKFIQDHSKSRWIHISQNYEITQWLIFEKPSTEPDSKS